VIKVDNILFFLLGGLFFFLGFLVLGRAFQNQNDAHGTHVGLDACHVLLIAPVGVYGFEFLATSTRDKHGNQAHGLDKNKK